MGFDGRGVRSVYLRKVRNSPKKKINTIYGIAV
jgi:hypothetical protein